MRSSQQQQTKSLTLTSMGEDTPSVFWSFCWLAVLVLVAWPLGILSGIFFNILLPFYVEFPGLEPYVVWARNGMELPYNISVKMSRGMPMISLENVQKSHESIPSSIVLGKFSLEKPECNTGGDTAEYGNTGHGNTAGHDDDTGHDNLEHSNVSSNYNSDQDDLDVSTMEREDEVVLLQPPSCKFRKYQRYRSQRPSREAGAGDCRGRRKSRLTTGRVFLNKNCQFSDKYVQTDMKSVSFSNKLTESFRDVDSPLAPDNKDVDMSQVSDHDVFMSTHSPLSWKKRKFQADCLDFAPLPNPATQNSLGVSTTPQCSMGVCPTSSKEREDNNSSRSTSYSSVISDNIFDTVVQRKYDRGATARKLDGAFTHFKRSKNHIIIKKKVYTIYKR